MTPKILMLAAALALAHAGAGAQTVWRCGNSYSQQPCAGGVAVTVAEPVTARPAATPVAKMDAKLAADLERARLAQERNAPQAVIIGPVEAPPVGEPRKAGAKNKTGKLEQFTAVAPGAKPAAKKKAKARD